MKLIDDIFKSKGHFSTNKLWHHVGCIVLSWIVVKQALLGTLTYDTLLVYAGSLVAPNLVSKLAYITKGKKGETNDNEYQ